MKKTAVFILILLLLVSALHADTGETLRLSATVKNVVYIGVTSKAITSSIVPDTINNIAFSFNPNTGKWESNEAYIYVISFVPYALKVTLSSNSNGLQRKTEYSSGPKILYYSGSVTPMNNSSDSMPITFTEESKTENKELYKETGTFTDPRVRSWKFSVVINPSKYTNTNYIPSGNEYQETFTLSISTKS